MVILYCQKPKKDIGILEESMEKEKLNWKKILLLCLPIVFAVSLAVTLAACMAQAGKEPNDSAVGDDSETTPPSVQVGLPGASEGLAFKSRGDGTCELIGIGSCTDRDVIIPEEGPDGDRVTAIGCSAFIGVKSISSVKIPMTVTYIGDYAFYSSSITVIDIPSSVKSIGECAFANCISLTAINVATSNESYCSIDGVLFSKDKSILIVYPSGKPGDSYTIRRGVGTIASAAFLNCVHLKKIVFNGTPAEWEKVKIGANNVTLTTLGITFAGQSIK